MKLRRWAAILPVLYVLGGLLAGAALAGAAGAAKGPIGWWKLNECSRLPAADSSGNCNNGAIGSAVTVDVPGARGTAYKFDGSANSYVDVPFGSGTLAPSTTHITVSAWINPSSFACGQCAVVSNEPTPGENRWGYGLRVIDNGITLQWCWGTEGGPGNCAYGAFAFPLNTWTNIVGTYDGATLNEYVNGVFVTSQLGVFPALNTLRDLFIGRLPSGNLLWIGGIDDVRVYNRVLSAEQIEQIAHPEGEDKGRDQNDQSGHHENGQH